MDPKIPVVDIHAHVNFAAYAEDCEAVLARAFENNVALINVGTQLDTSKKTVELAENFPHVFSCVGLHPIHTTKSHHDEAELGAGGADFVSRGEIFNSTDYEKILTPKVIAVGECGLDYYRNDPDTMAVQEKAFRDQIDFALTHNLPLMLHVRPTKDTQNAYEDVIKIISEYKITYPNLKANVHCFTGSLEIAKKFIEIGCTISFTGIVTFATAYDEVVKWVPADKFMVETDCPYLTPKPHRGQRNEPSYVRFIIEHIAKVRGEDADQLALKVLETNKNFFGVDFAKIFQ